MFVVACIKQVPDTQQVSIDPVSNTLVRVGRPLMVNPCDSHALEACLSMRDRYGFRAAALSMGPPSAEAALRKALAMGADQAILLSDPGFGAADTLSTSNVLAAAIRKLACEDEVGLIFCGSQSSDGDTAQVGPGVAVRLGYSLLSFVDRIDHLDFMAKKIRVRRKLEGRYEIVEAKLPALITVVRELNRPRYPTVAMRLEAEQAPLRVWDNGELKLDPDGIGLKGSPTRVTGVFPAQQNQGGMPGELLGNGLQDPSAAARLLVERLLERDMLAL